MQSLTKVVTGQSASTSKIAVVEFDNSDDSTTLRRAKWADRFDAVRPLRGDRLIEPIRGKAVPCGRNAPCPCGSGKKRKRCHR